MARRTPPTPPPQARDSLELASLASSTPSRRNSQSSSNSSSPGGISSSRKLSLEQEDPLAGPTTNHHHHNDDDPASHLRSYSLSSAFDFASALYPLAATSSTGGHGYAPVANSSGGGVSGGGLAEAQPQSLERIKSLTYLNGLSLVIGLQIGSGIFSSPSEVDSHAGSAGLSLVVWTVAGVLAWTGACSYAELGGMMPLNGGSQVYLAKTYGESTGFLFTWCSVFVLKPGSTAIISLIFGEYVVRAVVGPQADALEPWVCKAVGLSGLAATVALNMVSTRLAARVGDSFMVFKFLALLLITILGVVVAATGLSFSGHPSHEWQSQNWFAAPSAPDLGELAVALYAGLWAYDGWDNASYIVGEMRAPARDLPRVIHTAMPLVILSYLLANVAYYFVLPSAVITSSNTVAVAFGAQIFGRAGALVLSLIVSISCLGALNATTFTGARVVYAAGKEGYLPGFFSCLGFTSNSNSSRSKTRSSRRRIIDGSSSDPRPSRLMRSLPKFLQPAVPLFQTPIAAFGLNLGLATLYVLVGEFGPLLTFYGITIYTMYFATVLGLIILRVREPTLERPYRCWISTPIIFCCVSLFLVSRGVFVQPLQSMVVLGWLGVGLIVWWFTVRRRRKRELLRVGGDGQGK